MTTYRAYQLDQRHRIKAGQWSFAADDAEARNQAAELCEEGVESIELWQAQSKIDEPDCPPEEAPPKRAKG